MGVGVSVRVRGIQLLALPFAARRTALSERASMSSLPMMDSSTALAVSTAATPAWRSVATASIAASKPRGKRP